MDSVSLQLGSTGSEQNTVGSKPQNKHQKDEARLISSNCGAIPMFTLMNMPQSI